jgi:hypothetical protein
MGQATIESGKRCGRSHRGLLAAYLGIAAGLAVLIGVLAGTGKLDRSDVAVVAAGVATMFAGMVPLLVSRRGK